MKGKTLLIITSAIAVASIGYYLYEKRRVDEINKKVTSLEDALKQLEERNKESE
jgi:cellobiose-specific phosphotransferase system component IIC